MELLSSVVLVKIHNQRGNDIDLIATYNVRGFPTFVLASKDAETLQRWWGYSKDDFLIKMKDGLQDLTTIAEKKARFAKKPDVRTAKALAIYHYTRGELKDSEQYYLDAAKYDPNNDYAYELYDLYRSGFRSELYSREQVSAAAEKALDSEHVDTRSKLRIYDQMGGGAIQMFPGDAEILDYIRRGQEYARMVSDDKLQRYKDRINISYTLYIEKDIGKAVRLKKKTFKDGWQDSPDNLNNFAWWCFENKINLQEGEKMAERGAKLAESGSQKANILDTQAEIANLRGDPVRAARLSDEAVKEAPDREFFKKQQQRFHELANPKPQSKAN
jgi:tetratricopeptide (TPR) repeat protein